MLIRQTRYACYTSKTSVFLQTSKLQYVCFLHKSMCNSPSFSPLHISQNTKDCKKIIMFLPHCHCCFSCSQKHLYLVVLQLVRFSPLTSEKLSQSKKWSCLFAWIAASFTAQCILLSLCCHSSSIKYLRCDKRWLKIFFLEKSMLMVSLTLCFRSHPGA